MNRATVAVPPGHQTERTCVVVGPVVAQCRPNLHILQDLAQCDARNTHGVKVPATSPAGSACGPTLTESVDGTTTIVMHGCCI